MIRPARRLSKPDLRRALQLLAASADGYTEGLLRAHGVTTELLVGLVHAGLATAKPSAWSLAVRQSRSPGCGSRARGGRCSTGQSHEKAHVRAPHLRGPSHEMVG